MAAPNDILKAAKKSMDAGLAPEAALRALTLSPAEIYGVADRLGSIENGKIANLVITDGDLFNEKTKIKYVFVDGRRFDSREPEKPKDPPKGDLTGKWKLAYTSPEGAEESTADLTTANIISGYLSADKFSLLINIPIQGSPSDVTFTGTFDGTSLKGTIRTQGIEFDFTGTKPSGVASLFGGAQ
jgi:hypothetical protein